MDPDAKTYNGTSDVYTDLVGPTALALYTLLKCGVPLTDPRVSAGFEWLRGCDPESEEAYEVSRSRHVLRAPVPPSRHARRHPVPHRHGR